MPQPTNPNNEEQNTDENLLTPKTEGDVTMEIKTTGEITEEDDNADEGIIKEGGEEEQPFKTFKTEEEYQEFIAEERKKLQELDSDDKKVDTKPDTKKAPGDNKFFSEDWKPEDWNDFTANLLSNPKVREFIAKEYAVDIQTQLNELSNSERQEINDINAEFDKQYDDLAKQGLVPNRSTPEGKVIDQQISLIGATYGQTSMTKAYELWKKIPTKQGGGLDYDQKTAVKSTTNENKEKSAKIGSGRKGTMAEQTKVRKYEDVHSKSLDVQVQEALND